MRRRFESALVPAHDIVRRHVPDAVPLRITFLAFAFLAFVLLTVVVGVTSAWAQDASTGALRGSVLDAQGKAVTNADIVAICVETGVRYHTATDVAGRFVVDLLPPGSYSARAEAEGMSPEISPVIKVELGSARQLTFKLTVAGPKETVTVSGAPSTVDTSPNGPSALIDESAIANLPLAGRRYTDLLLLTPGVTQDPRGLTSGSNGDLSYGGIRGYNTSYMVDGTDDNNGFFAQARGRYRAPYQFSDEVVQQFRVSSNSYGAESGRSGGAVVNVVTKSGSNSWHGSAFYYLRDSSIGGAAPPFVGFNPSGQQHQFGGTVGGPIERNKMFFFAGYDQHIFHLPTVVEFENGAMTVMPQLGTPGFPLDYEVCDPHIGGSACDQTLVAGASTLLSQQGGTFPATMLGNTGFFKIDRVLGARNLLVRSRPDPAGDRGNDQRNSLRRASRAGTSRAPCPQNQRTKLRSSHTDRSALAHASRGRVECSVGEFKLLVWRILVRLRL